MPVGRRYADFNLWGYDVKNAGNESKDFESLNIGFDPKLGMVDEVECIAQGSLVKACDLSFGVGIDTTEKSLRNRLGDPQFEYLHDGTKTMFYKRLNLRFDLRKERVAIVALTESQRDTHALPAE